MGKERNEYRGLTAKPLGEKLVGKLR